MKVLFLDIDGVLNNTETFLTLNPWGHLDKRLIDRLDSVLARTGAKVVISSAWRVGDQGQSVARALRRAGMKHADRIIDETPTSRWIRGWEIRLWLLAHPEVQTYAIVDDMSDMGPVAHRLVQTDWDKGLQAEDAEALVALLGENGREVRT